MASLSLAGNGNGRSTSIRSQNDILNAAALCFKENGFSATSIDDVARSIGATKGMIYHHFRSKIDLFFEVYRRGMRLNFEAAQPEFDRVDPAQIRLARMGLAHCVVLMKHQAYQRVLSQGVTMHFQGSTTAAQRLTLDELIEMRNGYEALFRTCIEQAALEAGFAVTNPSLASKSFLAVLNSTVFWYSPRHEDPEGEQLALAEELVTFAMCGLGTNMPVEALNYKGTTL